MGDNYLKFWGVRGSYATPCKSHLGVGGNTSCVEIRADDHVLVCDAGTGVIPFGEAIMRQDKIREIMFILTHYHWDHVCGLPFFAPAFSPEWTINIFAPGSSPSFIKKHVSAQMHIPYFPVNTDTWMAKIGYLDFNESQAKEGLKHGPIRIKFGNVHHPGETYGYIIKACGKNIAYVSDNEATYLKKAVNIRQAELNEEESALYQKMAEEERLSEIALFKDADILIHDAQYTAEDYEKKMGWGHSCYVDTVNNAIDAGVKELYLYHHDPSKNDESIFAIGRHANEIIKERGSSIRCYVAREGMRVDL